MCGEMMKTFKQMIKLASQPLKSLKETRLDLSKSSEKQTHQHKVEDTSEKQKITIPSSNLQDQLIIL